MFETELRKDIEWLLEKLKETKLHHQRKKIKQLAICLNDVLIIDELIKTLKKKFGESLKLIDLMDPEATEQFYPVMRNLTERVFYFIQYGDVNIDKLNDLIEHLQSSTPEIQDIKERTEFFENQEIYNIHKMRYWIMRIRKAVRKAYKKDKIALLKDLDAILKDISKHLKKLEK